MARRRRPKTSGTIRKLPSGRWQARITLPDGEQIAIGSYATKTEADKALLDAAVDQRQGTFVDPSLGRITFGEYSTQWLVERSTIRQRTRELYDQQLRVHLLPVFAKVELASMTPAMIRQWHARCVASAKPSPSTLAKSYRLLRTILNTAVEDELLVRNPCMIRGAGVERTPERPVATIEQVYQIAEAIEPCYRMLVLLATFTGLRFGELSALTRARVDLQGRTVTVAEAVSELKGGTRVVGEPKTWAGRRKVGIPGALVEPLRMHLVQFAEPGAKGLVFVGPKGGPLRRGNFSNVWKRAVRPLGLDDLHFHDLRHTGNTLAAATGASTKELMARMGHSSTRAALIYQHATHEREMLIADKLSTMIESALESDDRLELRADEQRAGDVQ